MSEKAFRKVFGEAIVSLGGMVTNHEDKLLKGIGDVSFAIPRPLLRGWCELKFLDKWPVKVETPLRIGLTVDQRNWLYKRYLYGGDVIIATKIRNCIFVHSGLDVQELYEPIKVERFRELALAEWTRSINLTHFKEILCNALQ